MLLSKYSFKADVSVEKVNGLLNTDKIHLNQPYTKSLEKELLQPIIDSLGIATGLMVKLTEPDGRVIIASGESCEFCRLVQQNQVGLSRCRECYSKGGEQALKWDEPYIFRCHAGLIAVAAPVVVNNVHIANLICGEVLLWQATKFLVGEIKDLTKDLKLDEDLLEKAVGKINVISAARAQAIANVTLIASSFLAQSGTSFYFHQKQLRSLSSWFWSGNNRQQEELQGRLEPDTKLQVIQLENQIFSEIRSNNPDIARDLLKELTFKIFIRSAGQIELIKGYSIEFASSAARMATEQGVDFNDSINYNIVKMKELERADTVDKVLLWLTNIGTYYIELLTKRATDDNNVIITRAINYIQEHYSNDDLSLKKIAEALFVSSAYLSHLFKKVVGYNISEYINKLRIEQAKVLLLQSDSGIEDIAHQVGYSDRTYFSKVFKQQVGMIPSEFRKKIWL